MIYENNLILVMLNAYMCDVYSKIYPWYVKTYISFPINFHNLTIFS